MFATFFKMRSILTIMIFLVATAVLLNQTATNPASASDGTRSVIVELRADPGAVYKAKAEKAGRAVSTDELQNYRAGLRAGQDNFLKALAERGVNFQVKSTAIKNYDGSVAAQIDSRYTLVYNGITLSVPKSAIATIESMPEVKRVSANGLLFPELNKSVDYINATKAYGAVKELSQFDNVREGYEGQGMYISVIDTGIDWTHPMFGGDPTPPRLGVAPAVAAVSTNQKVVYNLPLTDSPVGDGFGHGTHVASTAAGYLAMHPGSDGIPGTGDDVRLHGVAPQAKLMSYTVCSTSRSTPGSLGLPSVGGCEFADILTALEDSVSPFTITLQPKPVANVINMSLGGGGGPDNPTAIAANNAALTGTIVVAASGNSGPGEGTTGSPAAGVHVISVAANTHPGGGSLWSTDVLQSSAVASTRLGAVSPANSFPKASGFERIKLFPMTGSVGLPASSMAQRYVFVNELAGPLPATVSGRILLLRGITASFADAALQASQAGAVGIIVMDSRGAVNGVKTTIPAAGILPEDGEALVDAISSTDNNNTDPADGAISELPIRMNPSFSDSFMGEMGGFSSRGPVRGLGQVKPDVSAPGVAVLAAVPPPSVLGALASALENTPNYMHLDGTSMATPHVAGAVAQIKQAHPDWTPDMVRTALINTATNMRNETGGAKADGPSTADSIIAQGGGLINVYEALNAKAQMGVVGDGITTPNILGSHSFGEVFVINSRVTHTVPVSVTVRDLSGQGGTYNLAVANNRDLQLAGISVGLTQQSVSVPANGQATFTVNATVDGDLLRDTMASKTDGTQVVFEKIQMQWYVTANRTDGGESLRMPFFFRPSPSVPAQTQVVTSSVTDVLPAADAGAQRDNTGFLPELNGVTYKDIPFEVDASTSRIEAETTWMQVATSGQPDLDYQLLGPDGEVVQESGNGVGPEFVSVNVTTPGTYTHRVIGWSGVGTEFTVTTSLTKGNAAPSLNAITGEFTDAQSRQVDFDGAFTITWQGSGGERGYEVERSTDNGNTWTLIAKPNTGDSSIALTDQPNGTINYRIRGVHNGQIGAFVTPPSNAQSILVDRRGKVDITAQVATAMSNVSFVGGVFKLDLNVKNNSTSAYVPLVELNVVKITSGSGTVSVKNAENAGNGKTAASPALFGYSNLLGADQTFTPAEITGSRTLEFNDSTSEMFSFDVSVTAYEQGAAPAGAAGGGAPAGGGGAAGSGGGGAGPLSKLNTRVLRITVNPLTKAVSAKLL
jgi:subtilisin family serine protease